MSHYAVVVIMPPGTSPSDAEAGVGSLLAPYDENLATEPHIAACECVGMEALLGTMGADDPEFEAEKAELLARSEVAYAADHPELRSPWDGVHPSVQGEWDEAWSRRQARQAAREAAHPMAGKPRPGCGDCGGSGEVMTTSNDEGRWDWWQIGGRWTAFFTVPDGDGDEYDPTMDPRNQERCLHCRAHPGKRFWREVPREDHPMPFLGGGSATMAVPAEAGEDGATEAPCNACDGTGVAQKWPTQWADTDTNYAPVETWRALLGVETHVPYAVVTADGRWHEKDGDWPTAVRALAAAAEPGSLVAIVDVHS